MKILISSGIDTLTANLTQTRGKVSMRGEVPASPGAEMVVNARVELPPDELESIVRAGVAAARRAGVQASFRTLRSLRPGRPTPTHRYAEVV